MTEYTTPEQVRNAADTAYRNWRSYGWAEGEAEQAAGEFYAYQMAELHKRQAGEIETICAWCGKHISGPVGADREHTSHGICEKCLEVEFPEKVTA